MLELVESLADYGADYRNFVRELLLHLREVLLVKLAPPGSPLLVADPARGGPGAAAALADALSEEDLLRGLDLLTRAESELRNVTDPRVALDLVLLKLVQMRRLVPFVELVARVERLLGGAASARRRPPRSAARAAGAASDRRAAPGRRARRGRGAGAGRAAPCPRAAAPTTSSARPRPRAPPRRVLASMLGQCQGRPSLAAPLRAATARTRGRHAGARGAARLPDASPGSTRDDYRALARKAAGHALALRIEAGPAPARSSAAAPSPEAAKRQKLREEAEKEPAVQEALDLFDGRVVDVRETLAREGGRVNPFGDPRKMMKQLQQAQERLQAEIAAIVVEASAGGGVVKVEMDGQKQLKSLKIDPEVVNRDDVEMLQDLVLSAVNEAARKVEATHPGEGGRRSRAG